MSEEAREEIRVMLVDDHTSFRQPLAFMRSPSLETVGLPNSGDPGSRRRGPDQRPDSQTPLHRRTHGEAALIRAAYKLLGRPQQPLWAAVTGCSEDQQQGQKGEQNGQIN